MSWCGMTRPAASWLMVMGFVFFLFNLYIVFIVTTSYYTVNILMNKEVLEHDPYIIFQETFLIPYFYAWLNVFELVCILVCLCRVRDSCVGTCQMFSQHDLSHDSHMSHDIFV